MNKKCCYIICSLIVTSIIGLVLSNAKAFATTTCVTDQSGLETCTDSETGAKTYKRTATVNASVTVGYSCSLYIPTSHDREFTAILLNGESVEVGGPSTSLIIVECNDASGYAVYAVGYSGDSIGNTDLISSAGSSYNIHTDGANSYWKMKLSTNSGSPPTIPTDYLSYHNIPSTYTKVAYLNGPSALLSSSFNTHYQAHAAIDQPAGDFVGKVKYVLVAPASAEPINIDSAFASAGKTKYNGYYKMQDMSTSICANVTAIDDEARLIDVRDDKVYYVTKLKDGNCWMTQNLYHDIDSSYDYNSDNTDVPDDWDEELNDTYVASSRVYDNWYDEPFSRLGYDVCWTGSGSATSPPATCNFHYHTGAYYNWTAAIASEDSSDFDGEVADQSICPAGWTLPSPTNYSNLISLYSDLTKSPTYFPLVGYVYTTMTAIMGSDTGYWTNKSTDTGNAKDLYLTSPQNSGGQSLSDNSRAYALSIRCIAR